MTVTQAQTSNPKPKKKARAVAAPGADDGNMQALGVGIDTGRYGHHVTFLREDKQHACPPMIAMETRTGYEQLRSQIERLHQRFPSAQIYLRIDAAGQYAANLESFLRSLTHLSMKISIGEPKRNWQWSVVVPFQMLYGTVDHQINAAAENTCDQTCESAN